MLQSVGESVGICSPRLMLVASQTSQLLKIKTDNFGLTWENVMLGEIHT